MRLLLIVVMACAANGAWAQSEVAIPKGDDSTDNADEAAKAAAMRPGDEDLTCEQLRVELSAVTSDPQWLAAVQAQGAFGQEQLERISKEQEDGANEDGQRRGGFGQAVRGFGRGLIANTNPAAARAEQAARAAENARMMAEAQRNNERIQSQFGQLQGSMPQMMRANRIVELAQARKCEWVTRDAEAAPSR